MQKMEFFSFFFDDGKVDKHWKWQHEKQNKNIYTTWVSWILQVHKWTDCSGYKVRKTYVVFFWGGVKYQPIGLVVKQ